MGQTASVRRRARWRLLVANPVTLLMAKLAIGFAESSHGLTVSLQASNYRRPAVSIAS
jgi:hypothetical protein